MNKLSKIILMLLIVIFAISSYFFIKELVENRKQNKIYNDLQEIIENPENMANEDDNIAIFENKASNISYENNYNLENLRKINADVVAWVKIDGTNINYLVMQNGDYYLHKNIYKKYSNYGTPYLVEYCNLNTSDNLIIYGHHMNDNTGVIGNYKDKYISLSTCEYSQKNGRMVVVAKKI